MKKANITDRAKRYRTNRAMEAAGRARDRCNYCGNPNAIDDEHVDGDESNIRPENLVKSCRSCNVEKGAAFARAGIGVKTFQYNPGAVGAQNVAQYLTAVMVLKGRSDAMPKKSAIKLIHNTPAEDRSFFAKQIWDRRRASGNDGSKVPF